MHARLFFLLVSLGLWSPVHAQEDLCGGPPPVAEESIKGEIEGRAQLLARFLGDAALSGQIQASRKEIFSKYPDAEISRSNAYFEYQVCIFLQQDDSLTALEKITELKKIRREFTRPTHIEGRIDRKLTGDATMFSCRSIISFDLFVKGSRIFGTSNTNYQTNFKEPRIHVGSGSVEGKIENGIIYGLEFEAALKTGNGHKFFRFRLDGDTSSGTITRIDDNESQNCRNGNYELYTKS